MPVNMDDDGPPELEDVETDSESDGEVAEDQTELERDEE